MTDDFDRILDECIDRMNRGDSLEDCLGDHTEYAQQLEPLLRVMLQTRETYSFMPSADVKTAARQRFNVARHELVERRREKRPLFGVLFTRPVVWAVVVAAIVIAIAAYFGLRTTLFPSDVEPSLIESPAPPDQPVPVPSPEGNFVFLISDEVNAIEDFSSINISISKIGISPSGSSEQWIEFEPEIGEVDLTQVKGEKTQQIWRGDIPDGEYSKVFIYVDNIEGILKETGEKAEVRLPSQKLHISKAFTIGTDSVVSFVFDVTVIKAGKSGKYNLQPQVKDSGAHYAPSQDKGKGKKH